MLKSLADRLAEAAAEWLHREVRSNYWGYAADESLDSAALIDEKYVRVFARRPVTRPAPTTRPRAACSGCSTPKPMPAWA
jgi:hypothetical protein